MDTRITADEMTALGVLGFLFFRMQMDERARRVYEAMAALSLPNTPERRLAHTGLAAVALETGEGESALRSVREALRETPLATRNAGLLLLKARALWGTGRRDEALAVRDDFYRLTASDPKPADREAQSTKTA